MLLNQSLKVKLLAFCLFGSSITLVVGAFEYVGLNKVTATYEHISKENLPKTKLLGDIFASYRRVRIALRTLGLNGISAETANASVHDVKEEIAKLDGFEIAYKKMHLSEKESAIFSELSSEWIKFKNVGEEVLRLQTLGTADSRAKMLEIFLTACPERAKAFTIVLEKVIVYQEKDTDYWVAEAANTARSTNSISGILVVSGLLASFGVGYLFSTSLSRTLAAVASDLSLGAEEVAIGSDRIASASHDLSASTTQQAAALQQTVAAVEEVSSMIAKNADNAQKSLQASQNSSDAASRGHKAVAEVLASIAEIQASNHDINSEIEKSNRDVSAIVKVIAAIGEKTKVINDIVFQTKLLSFNASVEAARAGEHGKGFAVVADEVGKLAQMSGNAAKEISAMLDESIQQVEKIVDDTKRNVGKLVGIGTEKIHSGTTTAENCGKVLEEIVANFGEVKQLVGEIATASTEQAQGVHEINQAMTQLDRVAQQNTTTSQEATDTSRSLKEQADALREMVATLKASVNGGKTSPSSATSRTSKIEAESSNVVGLVKRAA